MKKLSTLLAVAWIGCGSETSGNRDGGVAPDADPLAGCDECAAPGAGCPVACFGLETEIIADIGVLDPFFVGPVLTSRGEAGFRVTWPQAVPVLDRTKAEIRVIDLDAAGAPAAPEQTLSAALADSWFLSAASSGDGRTLVSWLDATSTPPGGVHRTRLIEASGALGTATELPQYVNSASVLSTVAMDDGFCSVYATQIVATFGFVARCFDNGGNVTGEPKPIDPFMPTESHWPMLMPAAGQSFLLFQTSGRPATAGSWLAQTTSNSAQDFALSAESFEISPKALSPETMGSTISLANIGGGVVLAYDVGLGSSNWNFGSRVFVRWAALLEPSGEIEHRDRIDPSDEAQIHPVVAGTESQPRALVVWMAAGAPPSVVGECDIKARLVGANGLFGDPFVVNQGNRTGCQANPKAVALANGDVAIVWIEDANELDPTNPNSIRGVVLSGLLAN